VLEQRAALIEEWKETERKSGRMVGKWPKREGGKRDHKRLVKKKGQEGPRREGGWRGGV